MGRKPRFKSTVKRRFFEARPIPFAARKSKMQNSVPDPNTFSGPKTDDKLSSLVGGETFAKLNQKFPVELQDSLHRLTYLAV